MNFWNRSILFVDWVWDFPPPRKIFQSGKIVCTVETGRGLSLEDEIVTINWERAFFSNYFYPETNILQWMKVYIKGFLSEAELGVDIMVSTNLVDSYFLQKLR